MVTEAPLVFRHILDPGAWVGELVGRALGLVVGFAVGLVVGLVVGFAEGMVGRVLGFMVGRVVGLRVGSSRSPFVGRIDAKILVGTAVGVVRGGPGGVLVGDVVDGDAVLTTDGVRDGVSDGALIGEADGLESSRAAAGAALGAGALEMTVQSDKTIVKRRTLMLKFYCTKKADCVLNRVAFR